MDTLESIGFSQWFEHHSDEALIATHEVARVVSVHKESYTITKGVMRSLPQI